VLSPDADDSAAPEATASEATASGATASGATASGATASGATAPDRTGAGRIDDRAVEVFRRDGFAVLRRFVDPDALASFRARAAHELGRASGNFEAEFRRLKYDLESDRDAVYRFLEADGVSDALARLTGRDLFFTFEICFELGAGTSRGFPWHVGVQSFGYQRSEDFGCTLWIPLDPVDRAGQHGGLALVPRHSLSGRFVYDVVEPAIVEVLERETAAGRPLTVDDYFALRVGVLNGPVMARMLEALSEDHDYRPGDALLFDKYVVHRSVPLAPGPLEARAAFVLRFVERGSRYDRNRAEALDYPYRRFGHRLVTRSHLEIDLPDGAPIEDSALFDNPRRRYVGAGRGVVRAS